MDFSRDFHKNRVLNKSLRICPGSPFVIHPEVFLGISPETPAGVLSVILADITAGLFPRITTGTINVQKIYIGVPSGILQEYLLGFLLEFYRVIIQRFFSGIIQGVSYKKIYGCLQLLLQKFIQGSCFDFLIEVSTRILPGFPRVIPTGISLGIT